MSLADELLADLEADHGDDELQDNNDVLPVITEEEEKMETDNTVPANGMLAEELCTELNKRSIVVVVIFSVLCLSHGCWRYLKFHKICSRDIFLYMKQNVVIVCRKIDLLLIVVWVLPTWMPCI